jgi:hypothetical protein
MLCGERKRPASSRRRRNKLVLRKKQTEQACFTPAPSNPADVDENESEGAFICDSDIDGETVTDSEDEGDGIASAPPGLLAEAKRSSTDDVMVRISRSNAKTLLKLHPELFEQDPEDRTPPPPKGLENTRPSDW